MFSEHFINVVIPFNRNGFDKTNGKKSKNINESIIDLLKNNGKLSRKDLTVLLDTTEGSIRHQLKKLQEEGIIRHNGPDKGGYWEIMK